MNAKSVVLINCRKKKKKTFIMCKQLNGPVLKSVKPSCLGWNWKKKKIWPGQNFVSRFRPEISISLSGRAGPGLKFFSLLRTGPGLVWKIRPMQTFSQNLFKRYWLALVLTLYLGARKRNEKQAVVLTRKIKRWEGGWHNVENSPKSIFC